MTGSATYVFAYVQGICPCGRAPVLYFYFFFGLMHLLSDSVVYWIAYEHIGLIFDEETY